MTDASKPSAAASASWSGERIAKVGTIISAVLASSCCWLPLLLLAVGVSGAGLASALGAYRPVFMVVTFGFLALAFYFTYRPRRAAAVAQLVGHHALRPGARGGGRTVTRIDAPSSFHTPSLFDALTRKTYFPGSRLV